MIDNISMPTLQQADIDKLKGQRKDNCHICLEEKKEGEIK